MRRNPRLVILPVLLALCSAGDSRAETAKEPRLESFQLYTENDTYLPKTTDRYYTNGIRFAWFRNPQGAVRNPEWTKRFSSWWCRTGPDGGSPLDIGYGHALGQNIYTPNSIVDPNPQPRDRPWAGYLYYSWMLTTTCPQKTLSGEWWPVENLFELQAGLVGPGAGANLAQSTIHRLVHSPKPRGWSNQLKNEPTANLLYLWRQTIGGKTSDVVPHWGIGLGNVMTYANTGATVRLGYHISSPPASVMKPTISRVSRARKVSEPFEFFLSAGVDGRFVPHNIFLDGNTFVSGPEIDVHRKNLVLDLMTGATVRYKAWRLDYTYVHRSAEFEPPFDHIDGVHRFGSFVFSCNLWRP
jgi:lipid A 3-O-deacylase